MSDRGVLLKIAQPGDLREEAFNAEMLKEGVVLGRHSDCQVTITGSDLVSSHHCQLSLVGDTVHLKDLNSTNGTYLEGVKISASGSPVQHTQVFSLGKKGPKISVMLVGFDGGIDATVVEMTGPQGEMTRMIDRAGGASLSPTDREALTNVAKELNRKSRRSRMIMAAVLLLVVAGVSYFFYAEAQKQKEEDERKAQEHKEETERIRKQQELTNKKVNETSKKVDIVAKSQEELKSALDSLGQAQKNELAAFKATFEESKENDAEELRKLMLNSRDMTKVFQEIVEDYRKSVFLIYSEVKLKSASGLVIETIGGFGTGWLASSQGMVVTNKHVIFPHRFKDELQSLKLRARELLGDDTIEYDEQGALIAAWNHDSPFRVEQNGTRPLNLDSAWLRTSHAIDPDKRQRLLRVTYLPEDDNILGGDGSTPIHNVDSAADLAILHYKGVDDLKPLPMLPAHRLKDIPDLSLVLALGYPNGAGAIRGLIAKTSPVTGAIRKVEVAEGVISSSAPIIPGNSGGPLIDEKGRVIGVTSRRLEATQNDSITIDHVYRALEEAGKLMRDW